MEIYYTLDGTEPNSTSRKYTLSFILKKKARIKAVVIDPATNKKSPVSIAECDVSKEKWKVIGDYKDTESTELIFDGEPSTAWTIRKKPPVDIVIDLGEMLRLKGFNYLPGQGRWNPGIISNYELYISKNGKSWGLPVLMGEFSNIKNTPIQQKKGFYFNSGKIC